MRGECDTDTPSAKKIFGEDTDKIKIGGETSSGLEELTDETEIGGETRRDEVRQDLFTQTFHTPEASTVSELWANRKK
jgi:hypothetical protein